MNLNHQPPSTPFQHWGLMLCMTGFFGLIGSAALLYISWSWLSDWGTFFEHWPYLLSGIKAILFGEQPAWTNYYHHLLEQALVTDFWCHLLLPPLVAFSLAAYLSFKALYVPGGRTLERDIDGLGVRLYQGKTAIRHAMQQRKKAAKHKQLLSLFLHPDVAITELLEIENILLSGKPGSGKTRIFLFFLMQLIKRRVRMLIYDAKREYTEAFYNAKQTILIAPWDTRSKVWNIAKDMTSPMAPAQFAEHIITDTRDPIWCQSARLILTGIIVSLKAEGKPWGWAELFAAMTEDIASLHDRLKQHYPQALGFVQENNRTTDSIMVTLRSDLQWMEWLALAWPASHKGMFSVTGWMQSTKAKRRVIVQGHPQFEVVGAPLCHALMSLMTDLHLSLDKASPCYLVLDELANFPKSPSLMRWLELGRERGGRTIAGTQAISQLKAIYGEHETDTLLSMFGNLVTLKVGSAGGTAEYMSKALGQRVVERPSYNQDAKGNITTSWQRIELPTVHTSQLTQLPSPSKLAGVPGFLTINGWSATYRLTWPITVPTQSVKREVPATWTQAPEQFPVYRPRPEGPEQPTQTDTVPARIAQRRANTSEASC